MKKQADAESAKLALEQIRHSASLAQESLKEFCRVIPKRVMDGSIQMARDYKALASKAVRYLDKDVSKASTPDCKKIIDISSQSRIFY